MTATNYNFLSENDPFPMPINTADTVNAGDIMKWDAASKTYRPLTVLTEGELSAAVALGNFPLSSNLDNNQATTDPFVPGKKKGMFNFISTNAETYINGQRLYIGANSQTVTNVQGGGDNADTIGFFRSIDGSDLVGDGVNKVQTEFRSNFPSPDLA